MLSACINPYPSIYHSYLYVICLTLGTAVVVDYKQKEKQPLLFLRTAFKQQWNGTFSLFWKQKECLIHYNFLRTYLNLHWLLQLVLSVCGMWFFWCKIWSLLWFFIMLKSFLFFFSPVAVLRLCHSLQLSTMFTFIFFCILLLPSSCSSFHSLWVILISVLWLTCRQIFFFNYASILPQFQKIEKIGFSFFLLLNPTDVFHRGVPCCPSRSFFLGLLHRNSFNDHKCPCVDILLVSNKY